jgi:hypothetical protein
MSISNGDGHIKRLGRLREAFSRLKQFFSPSRPLARFRFFNVVTGFLGILFYDWQYFQPYPKRIFHKINELLGCV